MAEQTIPSPTEQPVAPRTERRAWIRFRSEQEISCQPDEVNTAWLGKVQDVSPGGIALILRRRFEPGASLSIELTTQGDWPRRLVARVVHATQEMDGRWIVGCAFARPLSEQELQTLLGE